MQNRIDRFLENNHMHENQISVPEIRDAFLEEMHRGLKGEISSLGMYPSYIPIEDNFKFNRYRRIVAVDAGGTHLRTALALIDENGTVKLEGYWKHPMIGRHEILHSDEFFDIFTGLITPYLSDADAIGISFSFPGKITHDRDLIIAGMAKEIDVEGIENLSLRDGLLYAIKKRSHEELPIIAVNDTVSSLVSAIAINDIQNYDAIAGLIVGTGTNTCYREESRNIKIPGYSHIGLNDIINVESGSFAGFRGGTSDEMLDRSSALPGDHIFEKMIGGKYLGELVYITCKEAQKEGLISEKYDLSFLNNATAKDLDHILLEMAQNNPERAIKKISLNIVHRAAKLIAANLSAILSIQGSNINKALLSFEGSTIKKLTGLEDKVRAELSLLHKDTMIEYVTTDNAVLIGSAIAAALCTA